MNLIIKNEAFVKMVFKSSVICPVKYRTQAGGLLLPLRTNCYTNIFFNVLTYHLTCSAIFALISKAVLFTAPENLLARQNRTNLKFVRDPDRATDSAERRIHS